MQSSQLRPAVLCLHSQIPVSGSHLVPWLLHSHRTHLEDDGMNRKIKEKSNDFILLNFYILYILNFVYICERINLVPYKFNILKFQKFHCRVNHSV